MKATLKKYSFQIIVIIVILFFDFYFLPRQSEFYTQEDIDVLKDSKFWMILLLEVLFFGLLFLFHFLSIKKVKDFLSAIAIFGIMLLFFFSVFQSTTISIYLFLNRQKSTSETMSKYRLLVKKENEKQYYLELLYSYESEEIIRKNIEIEYADFIRLKKDDTVTVKFQNGWFGIRHTPEFVH